MKEVLIVDDEAAMRAALEANFRLQGWRVQTASGVSEALSIFEQKPSQLVITDMRMTDGDGLQVMEGVRKRVPEIPVILLTAYGSVPDAVMAMKGGACDYLQKPIPFAELESAADRFVLWKTSSHCDSEAEEVVGRSSQFRRLIEQAKKAAESDADILIQAESGTGKEVIARIIHKNSPRRLRPFVAVNCSAFPENLLESELFGHVRGAFTGAERAKAGKFEQAHGGTLLLDEIGDLPLALQPKLLRVLQEREVDRLGDTKPTSIDVRIIATTNRPLQQQVKLGAFRADLYYRLNVVPLTIAPLRERREDIIPLANYFLRKYEPKSNRTSYGFSAEFAEQLESYGWPGNVRELENVVRRELALSDGKILNGKDTSFENDSPDTPNGHALRPGVTLEEAERHLLENTLEATGGNRTRAAEMMGVSLRTVRNKIREYGLPGRRQV